MNIEVSRTMERNVYSTVGIRILKRTEKYSVVGIGFWGYTHGFVTYTYKLLLSL